MKPHIGDRRGCSLALLGTLCVAPLVVLGASGHPEFQFTAFDVPGANYTEAYNINSAGDVVGVYAVPTRAGYSGFLLRNGEFTSIDYPASEAGPAVFRTDARAVNPAGDVVGIYRLVGETSGTVFHSYLLTRHGEFVNIDVPGWMGTVVDGILPDGTILGCVHNTDMTSTMYGLMRSPEGGLSISSVQGTMNYGATPDQSMVVGRYATSGAPTQHYGFILDEAGLNFFRVPGTTFTQAWGVNPRREIVGYSWAAGAGYRGFLRHENEYTTLTYPGAAATYAMGINPRGDVVGSYYDGTRYHAFIAIRAH